MGKPTNKNKNHGGSKSKQGTGKQQTKTVSQKALDEDMAIFITMSQEIKEEGKKLFKERDHEGAMLKYEKAVKLLPKNHIDVAYLHTSMAACYMQMGTGEYTRAISECDFAIEVAPKYSKALLNRARCYEALNMLDLARSDVDFVLGMEPNNLAALEMMERVKTEVVKNDILIEGKEIDCGTDTLLEFKQVLKEKVKKSNNNKANSKKVENKVVFKEKEEKVIVKEYKVVTKTVKLVFGEDIRWAQLPANCTIGLVRDIVRDRFPSLKGILLKYIDQDGDFVTITTTDELRLVDSSSDSQSVLKFYIVEVSHDQEPFYEEMVNYKDEVNKDEMNKIIATENREVERSGSIDNDIQFARLFKNHVGFNSDSYMDLHDSGMKLYSEAMEDTVTNEEAQELFGIASETFQEMAALALFNWGNVHMSKAKKRVLFPENDSKESILAQIKTAYEWAEKEYVKAGMRYKEAIKIKPDFFEGLLALGLQQFEQAKVVWYYAVARKKVDLEDISSTEILNLYNKSEDSMEMGMQMWEEMEERRLNGILKEHNYKSHLQKMGLDGVYKDISAEEAAERAANMRSQIYLLWGTLLYERSIVEFKLELPTWQECLEVAVEKFELAGASPTDLAVMIKNHCSNETALKGIGFKIDEIVQAWNEMYDAKRWETGVPSFRLEPLLRRRVPNLYYFLEYI